MANCSARRRETHRRGARGAQRIRPPAQPRKLAARVSGRIELQAVRFAYPTRPERWAIDDISLAVEPETWPLVGPSGAASRPCRLSDPSRTLGHRRHQPGRRTGETLALVGPSGAGKSTLFDLLLRFFDPQQGRLLLDGQPIVELDPADLRRSFALVSQNPRCSSAASRKNIRYGRPHASAAEVEAAARAAHAHEFILGLPQGCATHLGEGGIGLSGGQRQRLAIARALLVDAPVLLLDEATSALDAESEHLIQQALPNLMSGRTTLVIAHRLATVQSADRIAVIDQGRLVAIGSHARLIAENPLYARLAELQFAAGGRSFRAACRCPRTACPARRYAARRRGRVGVATAAPAPQPVLLPVLHGAAAAHGEQAAEEVVLDAHLDVLVFSSARSAFSQSKLAASAEGRQQVRRGRECQVLHAVLRFAWLLANLRRPRRRWVQQRRAAPADRSGAVSAKDQGLLLGDDGRPRVPLPRFRGGWRTGFSGCSAAAVPSPLRRPGCGFPRVPGWPP